MIFKKAIADVQAGEGLSMREAAHKYGVPSSTLHDHLKGKSKKAGAGGPTVLMAAEEREVALTCLALADMGFAAMAKPCIAHVHAKIRGAALALGHVTRHKAGGVACSSYMASGLRSALGPSSKIDPLFRGSYCHRKSVSIDTAKKKKTNTRRSLVECCRVSSYGVMPPCESKLASRSSRKAKAVFVE